MIVVREVLGQSWSGPPYFSVCWMLWIPWDEAILSHELEAEPSQWFTWVLESEWDQHPSRGWGFSESWYWNQQKTVAMKGNMTLRLYPFSAFSSFCSSSTHGPALPVTFWGVCYMEARRKGLSAYFYGCPPPQLPGQWVLTAIEQACTHSLFYCTAPQKDASERQGSDRNLTPSSPLHGFNVS